MDRKTMSILAKKRNKPDFRETGEIDLQLFAEAISGRRIIYLYRLLSEAESHAATRLAFATENGRTKSKDADSTATKDGSIRTPGTAEVEITSTSVLSKGDTIIDKLVSIHAPAKGATGLLNMAAASGEFQSTLPRRERLQNLCALLEL